VKVLVVEDSGASRRILETAVAELGHQCVAADDGLRAWELFQGAGADVVISDWTMPGIDGDELCRRVRAADGAYCYFIMLSSHTDKRHVMRGMEAGADDYLTKPLDPDELEARLAAASRVTGIHRRLAEQQGELERLNRELHRQARTDPLTGVANRLRMREDLDTLEGRVERYGHTYAALLCDIDRFKRYNDACGHVAGDDVLRSVADALADACRRGDVVYRYGGEEMLVLLPEQDLETAVAAAERMRSGVEALQIPHPGIELAGLVTISIGVVVWRGGQMGGSEGMLKRADEALYRAKREGRNKVIAADAAPSERERA
jgi:two-component system chemotaxis response regulator CheY